jgi:hypothetical protein
LPTTFLLAFEADVILENKFYFRSTLLSSFHSKL